MCFQSVRFNEHLNEVTVLSDNISAMIVIAIILITTYFLISTEKINKTLAALLGGIAVILFVKIIFLTSGIVIFTDAELFGEIIDWRTITIVVSVLVIVEVVIYRCPLSSNKCIALSASER